MARKKGGAKRNPRSGGTGRKNAPSRRRSAESRRAADVNVTPGSFIPPAAWL